MADHSNPLSDADFQFLRQLRDHPQLYERVRSLLELAGSGRHTLAAADEVEARLSEQLRQLGSTTMESWAAQAEQTAADELLGDHPNAQLKKKGPPMV